MYPNTLEGREKFLMLSGKEILETIGARFGAFFGAMIVSSLTFWGLKFAFGVTSTDMQAMIIPEFVSAVLLVGGQILSQIAANAEKGNNLLSWRGGR